MKKKNFISLTIAFAFVILAISGILLYIKQKPEFVEMAHTIFGLLFIGFVIFHILNNWASIKSYSKDRSTGSIKKELVAASLVAGVVLVLSVTGVLEPVAEFGRIFAKEQKRPAGISFEEKTTLDSTAGKPVTLFLQKSAKQNFAALTIEVADSTGKVVETLFAPDKERKGPPASLILQTKISTPAPFKIMVTAAGREGEKSQQELLVRSLEAGIQTFTLTDQSPLKRAFVEIK